MSERKRQLERDLEFWGECTCADDDGGYDCVYRDPERNRIVANIERELAEIEAAQQRERMAALEANP